MTLAWDLGWGGGVATAASGDAAGSRGSRLQLAAANREYSGRADGVRQLFQLELEAAAPEPSCSPLPPPSYLIWPRCSFTSQTSKVLEGSEISSCLLHGCSCGGIIGEFGRAILSNGGDIPSCCSWKPRKPPTPFRDSAASLRKAHQTRLEELTGETADSSKTQVAPAETTPDSLGVLKRGLTVGP